MLRDQSSPQRRDIAELTARSTPPHHYPPPPPPPLPRPAPPYPTDTAAAAPLDAADVCPYILISDRIATRQTVAAVKIQLGSETGYRGVEDPTYGVLRSESES